MGASGTLQTARNFLEKIDLRHFKKRNRSLFENTLNEFTVKFKKSLPKGSQNWGSARKFLNIFLRDVFYSRYLCQKYNLYHLEPWLEIPLDSHVAKGLRLEDNAKALPKWRTVIGLSPKENKIYQDFAEKVAVQKGTFRVHLDLRYWRGDHMANESLKSHLRTGHER